jgi:hypothetical protein
MNTGDTGHNGTNFLIYAMTMMGTFLTENWYLVIMIAFGLVHVYVAFQRHLRDEKKFKLESEAMRKAMEDSAD